MDKKVIRLFTLLMMFLPLSLASCGQIGPQGIQGEKGENAPHYGETFIVTYHLNGGNISSSWFDSSKTNVDSNTVTQVIDWGDTLDLPIVSKVGYAFNGWYTSNDDVNNPTRQWYSSDAVFVNLDLYASLNTITYNITYDLNGGTLISNNPSLYTVEDTFTLNNPTKTGYTFLGWTGSNGNTPSTNVTITNETGDKSYTANWEVNTYTITLDANGGECSTNSLNLTYGSNYTLPSPTKDGYTFDGWYNGNDKFNSTGTWTYTNISTLIAKWTIINYSISYNLNGGNISLINPTSYTVEDSFTLVNPTKTGYTFLGWTGSNGSTPTLNIIINNEIGNKEYMANWSANTYTITLDANGGICSDNEFSVSYDSSYTLPSPTYSKEGYTFGGWYNGEAQIPTTGTWIYENINKLTAKWTAITYSITYNLNGGSVEKNPMSYTVEDSFTLVNPTKTGYTFLGWTGSNGSTASLEITITNEIGDRNYIANWSANSYIITFDANGGICSDNEFSVFYGSSYTLPIPTYEGYTFGGWYNGEAQIPTTGTWIYENINKLTAKWFTRSAENSTFGSYPQSKVTDTAITDALTIAAGSLPTSSNSYKWTLYKSYVSTSSETDFMWYIDITHTDGNKYRGVYFVDYRRFFVNGYYLYMDGSVQDNNGYYTNTIYWFKWESIEWNKFNYSNGKNVFDSKCILDSQQFSNGKNRYNVNNYEYSYIREFANNNFYNDAFSEDEKALIKKETVDNSAFSTDSVSNKDACNNSEDYIYLLSYQEVIKYYSTEDIRQKKVTDYAMCQGCSGVYWLRSPSSENSGDVLCVNSHGGVYNDDFGRTTIGLVPALTLK